MHLQRLAVALASAVVLAVAITACGSDSDTGSETSGSTGSTSSASTAEGPFKIGFVEPIGGQPWRELALATMENLASQDPYKDEVELEIVRTQNNDPAQQVAAMRNLIAKGVDMLLFDPASPTAADSVIAEADSRGIPVMAVGQDIPNEAAFVVSTDWTEAATIGAEWLVEQLEGEGNDVVVLEGIKGAPINEEAMPEVLRILEEGGENVVATNTNGWDESVAEKNIASILQSQDQIDGVYSYLAGGQGIPNAFANADRPFVPVVGGSGYNGEACTLEKYKGDGLTGILTSGQQAIYAKGLQQAYDHLTGKEIEQRQLYPPLVVSSEDDLAKVCLKDKPALFGIGYEFPGLNLPLDKTLEFFEG